MSGAQSKEGGETMSITRWEPFHELVSLRQAMDRLFEDSFVRPSQLASVFGKGLTPPVDMYEADNEVVVKVALPGVKPEELDINITGDTLTIKGETKVKQETKQENYLRQECCYGAFARSLTLPAGLKTDKAEASLDNGMLTLAIPKAEEAKPKVIKVKTKEITEAKKVETES